MSASGAVSLRSDGYGVVVVLKLVCLSACLLIAGAEVFLPADRRIKALRKRLRARVVFRSAYVDENSVLLQCIDSVA